MKEFVLSLDQGTTSSRAIVFDHNGQPCAVAQKRIQTVLSSAGLG